LIQQYLARNQCCGPGGCGNSESAELPTITPLGWSQDSTPNVSSVAERFIAKTLDRQIGAKDLFRITITSFLDVYNFDVRRVMKCCTHHVLPTGHIIPFCAYNVLYRDGHVPLPKLHEAKPRASRRTGSSRPEPAGQ
jgi:hypothetical protein